MAAQRGQCHNTSLFARPFITRVSCAPHYSPLSAWFLVFRALNSHQQTLLEWALSVGHGPKPGEVEAKAPRVSEGRAGSDSHASAPLSPPWLLLGKAHPGPSQSVLRLFSVENLEIRHSLNPPKGQCYESLNFPQF